MKIPFSTIASAALLGLCLSNVNAIETAGIDSAGYIRDWVMLAPIVLPERGATGDLLLKDQIKNEESLKPKEGDQVTINGKELTWKNITAKTNFFDLNVILNSLNDRAAGYMVTYVECEQDIPNVMISVGSNDQGRICFNGVDIYAFTEPRPLMIDADKGKITLKKGVNVVVFKVINETNSWQGSMRLTDMAGNPLKGLKIKQSP